MITTEIKQKLSALQKPAITLELHDETRNSKFGGLPSVESAKFEWPTYDGNPLAFLGQIDLEEMAEVHRYDWLPGSGYLLFFYDMIELVMGMQPEEHDGWRVIYQEKPDACADYPADIDVEARFEERFLIGNFISRQPAYRYDYDRPEATWYGLTALEYDDFGHIIYEEFMSTSPFHQFSGSAIQQRYSGKEMEHMLTIHAQQATGKEPEEMEFDQHSSAENENGDWTLLFQIGTDKACADGFEFLDESKLCFYVQKEKASKKNFNDCWMVMEMLG